MTNDPEKEAREYLQFMSREQKPHLGSPWENMQDAIEKDPEHAWRVIADPLGLARQCVWARGSRFIQQAMIPDITRIQLQVEFDGLTVRATDNNCNTFVDQVLNRCNPCRQMTRPAPGPADDGRRYF